MKGLSWLFRITRKKFDDRSMPEENLKSANWNVVEYQTQIQQAQELKGTYEVQLRYLHPAVPLDIQAIRTSLRGLVAQAKNDLQNLFKKKRTAVTHVLVLMLSDERRKRKPNALPIRYVPYRSLGDQYVRDLTRDVKVAMQEKGLNLVGQYHMDMHVPNVSTSPRHCGNPTLHSEKAPEK